MHIDLTQAPAPAEQLAQQRQHYGEVLKTIARRDRLFKFAYYTMGATGLVSALALSWVGYISGGPLAVMLALVGAFAVAGGLTLSFAFAYANWIDAPRRWSRLAWGEDQRIKAEE